MRRNDFIKNSALLTAGIAISNLSFGKGQKSEFPIVRVAKDKRNFTSLAVENAITAFQKKVKNPELCWLFGNSFPNTLDTTVFYEEKNGKPDTYVITGDIDAMWLRDSSAQVYPYLQFCKEDKALHKLIVGVINKQSEFIHLDPYANAFYNDPAKISEWKESDLTLMKPGVHERKWEIDSLCYPIRLAYKFWKLTGDTAPFDSSWKETIRVILKTFKEQQRKDGLGPYKFQRKTAWATDGVAMGGYGYPANPVGLICSTFRPSDDATIYSYLIPSNFFAVVSLKQAAEMISKIYKDATLASELNGLAREVETALKMYAVATHPQMGKIYAFEADGYGGSIMMDDANVPSLLSLPYLGAVNANDPIYQNTRKYVWSKHNPFFFKGTAAEGIGGPHIGLDMIWPMSLTMKALTSNKDAEIRWCIDTLQNTHGGTGFMHESFHKDDPKNFTRKWFAWSNTLFGELLWKTFNERPNILKG